MAATGGPRSLEELIAGADAYADAFEVAEPDEARPVDPIVELRLAALRRSVAERELAEAVQRARAAGVSWAAIGQAVGTTGEAARQRHGRVAPPPARAAASPRPAPAEPPVAVIQRLLVRLGDQQVSSEWHSMLRVVAMWRREHEGAESWPELDGVLADVTSLVESGTRINSMR